MMKSIRIQAGLSALGLIVGTAVGLQSTPAQALVSLPVGGVVIGAGLVGVTVFGFLYVALPPAGDHYPDAGTEEFWEVPLWSSIGLTGLGLLLLDENHQPNVSPIEAELKRAYPFVEDSEVIRKIAVALADEIVNKPGQPAKGLPKGIDPAKADKIFVAKLPRASLVQILAPTDLNMNAPKVNKMIRELSAN